MIGCYRLLRKEPPNRGGLARFVLAHHPGSLKKLEQEHREFEFQQIQSLLWLGDDASSFRDQVRAWTSPQRYLPQYEKHGYPVFRSQLTAFICRDLLGLPADDLAPKFVTYLDARRRTNGSFNNTPAADGGDGHVLNTWWGLQALRVLRRPRENRDETVAWLRACQRPGGGFTYQPEAEFGGVDDVAYTWAAARALQSLGAGPADRPGCVRYLASLWNHDGGAGDRPGWASNPVATYYALDALDALDEPIPAPRKPTPSRVAPLPPGLKVFTAQIEAHGKGSPAEAVDLARALKVHLWGAKNARPEWLKRAQEVADRGRVPVRFFAADEEYGTWVDVPGLGTYSHISDVFAPAGSDFGPSLASRGVVSWPEFRAKRLDPLRKAGGRLVWQFGENEELARIYLDDSIERGGYAAISTFHFGNPDFTNSEPFLFRYRGHLPFVALQDAHGDEPWWFADMTTGFRTLFLATEPTWEGWLSALRENRVVAVRRDAASGFKTWLHGGPREVIDFVRRREAEWRWWDNPEVCRPRVSLVALTPADVFEAARPERGVTLRVRCAWENTAQGLPKRPITELVRLSVDGMDVAPTLVSKGKGDGTPLRDHYHQYHLPAVPPGRHTATAVVRTLAAGAESSRTIAFDV
ncbi:MAG: terpene cyclase/mutase family protein [Planctomycetia bacterium]|nr:terpene cyclase/mutase family protein [Planctomycetia bacterium]